MKKPTIHTRTSSWSVKNTLRFNPLIALVVVVLVGGAGLWTLRSGSADNSGVIRIRAYSVENGTQVPVSGVSGQVYAIHPCSGQPIYVQASTNSSGLYTYQYNTNCSGNDAIFCLPLETFSRAGYTAQSASVDAGNSNTGANGTCGSITGALLSFTVLFTPNPTLTFSTSSSSITRGSSSTLTWSSVYTTTCNATAGGINTSGAKSGSVSVSPTQNTTYTISCTNAAGLTVVKSVAVNVTAAPTSPGASAKPNSSTKKPTPTSQPATVNATSGDTVAPGKPESFSAIVNDDKTITISWEPATDNVKVTGYTLERSTDALGWTVLGTAITETNYLDTNLDSKNSHYYYRIKAQDAAGNLSETLFAEIDFTVDTTTVPTESESEVADKKSEGMPVSIKIGGGVLLLVLIAAVIVVILRRRAANQYANTAYYNDASQPQPVAQLTPINPTNQPPVPIQQPAPHTSKSLKEMVLEDYHPDQNDKLPPQPGSQ